MKTRTKSISCKSNDFSSTFKERRYYFINNAYDVFLSYKSLSQPLFSITILSISSAE